MSVKKIQLTQEQMDRARHAEAEALRVPVGEERPQSFKREGCNSHGCMINPPSTGTNDTKCRCAQSVIRAHIEALRAENARLREALEKAIAALIMAEHDVADWGCYASQYFQDKHRLDDDVKFYKAEAIAAAKALRGGEGVELGNQSQVGSGGVWHHAV